MLCDSPDNTPGLRPERTRRRTNSGARTWRKSASSLVCRIHYILPLADNIRWNRTLFRHTILHNNLMLYGAIDLLEQISQVRSAWIEPWIYLLRNSIRRSSLSWLWLRAARMSGACFAKTDGIIAALVPCRTSVAFYKATRERVQSIELQEFH